ncbi:uncharacterized protein LOC110020707 [Phalaenopsis equestris]|uniref:uncharacterized protein LOC110020707 n=1 Tax=Phalaenopsis equestris TaxID=78828 RepID=UPI0009E3AB06|nr:uncharacterized protein LOC110020707 [Phalaenopsis equestris]
MGPSAKPTNPRGLHSIRNNQIKRKLSALRGADAFLLVFIPPEPSANFIADGNRSLNPTPNQENRRVSVEEEFVAMNKVLEKVRARLNFLESVAKQNAENSSNHFFCPCCCW